MSLDHLRSSLQGGAPLGAPLILTRLAPCIGNTAGPLSCQDPVLSLLPRTSSVMIPSLPSAPTHRTQRFLASGMLGPSLRRVPS